MTMTQICEIAYAVNATAPASPTYFACPMSLADVNNPYPHAIAILKQEWWRTDGRELHFEIVEAVDAASAKTLYRMARQMLRYQNRGIGGYRKGD
jgi:hypothetical protein